MSGVKSESEQRKSEETEDLDGDSSQTGEGERLTGDPFNTCSFLT